LSLFETLFVNLDFHLIAGQLLLDFILDGSRDFFFDVFGCSFGNRVGILTELLNVLSVVWIVAAHRRTKLHTVLDSRCACSIQIHNSFSFSKYIFADKMTDKLRYAQITGSGTFHQLLFFFSWQTDSKQSDIVHISHPFHLYVKEIEERMNNAARAVISPRVSRRNKNNNIAAKPLSERACVVSFRQELCYTFTQLY